MSATIVQCTCPDADSAARIARALVQARLAACVQAIGGVSSTYRWNEAVTTTQEVLLLIKTRRERLEAVRTCVLALHPYELPQFVAVDIDSGHPPYLDWIARETADPA